MDVMENVNSSSKTPQQSIESNSSNSPLQTPSSDGLRPLSLHPPLSHPTYSLTLLNNLKLAGELFKLLLVVHCICVIICVAVLSRAGSPLVLF